MPFFHRLLSKTFKKILRLIKESIYLKKSTVIELRENECGPKCGTIADGFLASLLLMFDCVTSDNKPTV